MAIKEIQDKASGCAGGILILILFVLPSGIPAAITWFLTKSAEATKVVGVLAAISLWAGFYVMEKHNIFWQISRDDNLKLLFFSAYVIGGVCYYYLLNDMGKKGKI